MNTSRQKCRARETGIVHRVLAGLPAGALLTPFSPTAGADSDFQHRVLFSPSNSQLKAEARGRVMIYDGLDNAEIERAFDEQFNRIENMLFVRTRSTEPDGEFSYEDDGCD